MRKTLEALLAMFNPAAQLTIRKEVETAAGLAVYGHPGRYWAETLDPGEKPQRFKSMGPLVGYWSKPTPDFKVPSRTVQAVTWLEQNPNETMREASRRFALNVSAISREIKRRQTKVICPHCGRASR